MSNVTREELLRNLEEDWGSYTTRFQSLTPEAQAQFLEQQGYARLADLLGHVLAWWEEGIVAVRRLTRDPQADLPDYDVDGFNFKAVRRFKKTSDEEVLERYNEVRGQLVELIRGLPDEALEIEQVCERLRVEVIEHLSEHALAAAGE